MNDRPCAMPDGAEFYCNPQTVAGVPCTPCRNLGGERFKTASKESGFSEPCGRGMGIAIVDFDGNGFSDVFFAMDTVQKFLCMNQGNGRFEEMGLLYGVAYNADAARRSGMGCHGFQQRWLVDIVYNNLKSQLHALSRNEQGQYFDYVNPDRDVASLSRNFSGWSNGFVDIDYDGWKDIYSANGDVDCIGPNTAQQDSLLRNLNGQHFVDVSSQPGEDFNRRGFQLGSAFGDPNNDGFQDLVVTSLNEKPDPPELGQQRKLLAPRGTGRNLVGSGRDRYGHQAHDRIGKNDLRSRQHRRGFHVHQRQGSALRTGAKKKVSRLSRSAGSAAKPRFSKRSRWTRSLESDRRVEPFKSNLSRVRTS